MRIKISLQLVNVQDIFSKQMVTQKCWLKINLLIDLQDNTRFGFIDLTEARRRLILGYYGRDKRKCRSYNKSRLPIGQILQSLAALELLEEVLCTLS